MPKIRYTKFGSGPDPQHNFRPGKTGVVSSERAAELIEAGAAVLVDGEINTAKSRQSKREER